MTYHQAFNRLGEPVQPPRGEPASRAHHCIQATAWTVAALCACALIWMR